MTLPWQRPIEFEQHGDVTVAREDKVWGGTKARFLHRLISDASEVVYGGPFCGGAALALSHVGNALGIPVTLFYAQRATWHPRQLLAQSLGAKLIGVPMGFQSHVTAKAQAYAKERGATYLAMGYDLPEATAELMIHLAASKVTAGKFRNIYVACSSGMLTKCLAHTWPEATVCAVAIGLKSHWSKQNFPGNVRIVEWGKPLSVPAKLKQPPPFSCCPYYEQKAWAVMQQEQPAGATLFWNVLGNPT